MALPTTLPVIALAFSYHIMVPRVASSLACNPSKITSSIAWGVFVPFLMYIAFDAAILGSQQGGLQPFDTTFDSTLHVFNSVVPADVLSQTAMTTDSYIDTEAFGTGATSAGSSTVAATPSAAPSTVTTQSESVPPAPTALPRDPMRRLRPAMQPLVDVFSLFAISSSYITWTLSLAQYAEERLPKPAPGRLLGGEPRSLSAAVADSAPQMPTANLGIAAALGGPLAAAVPYLLALGAPVAAAALFPDEFYEELSAAGTWGGATLFGLLPAAMAYRQRYAMPHLQTSSSRAAGGGGGSGFVTPRVQMVGGGRPALALMAAGALYVIVSHMTIV